MIDDRSMAAILYTDVCATNYDEAVREITSWTRSRESRYVCICNVHMIMEAYDDPKFRDVVNGADLVTADGVPLVWCLKMLGHGDASRVYGPELTKRLCERAESEGLSVGFFGGTEEGLRELNRRLGREYPSLKIAYSCSPPFRQITQEEDREIASGIVNSGVQILFVGLGCPKQERWMADHKGQLPVVMVGVGAAFDFLAGLKAQAPSWMQRSGLEWLFRLLTEPRRLWVRYLKHNPRFVWLAGKQIVTARLGR